MIVTEVGPESQAEWDAFVREAPGGSFLQSWAWGEFQRAAGFPIHRLVIASDNPNTRLVPRSLGEAGHSTPDSLVGACLLLRRPLPLRRFSLYAPWGPVFKKDLPAADVAAAVSALAGAFRTRLRGGVFARVELKLPKESGIADILKTAGFTSAERNIQPQDTRVLDLTQSEDALLRAMHPKARYNIRLAGRHGVVVRENTTPRGLRIFLDLAREVARRERFHYHPERYYEALLNALTPVGMLTLRVAEHQGIPLAAGLFVRFGDTMTYAHGASSSRRKHVMAPHLLHWESILQAKASDAARYDFFGVAPPGASVTHPWFGITRFKQGFGGVEEHYVGTADLVVDPTFYRLYEAGRSLRSLLR
ncbi:MAG: peptidoglycan bridge formation glycyltransferase FemA/FemB family protein [bacterium]|nr:peptidoglycan bridge formation glycyltransferase FemA/FemB family protein [bacterium]